MVHTPLLHGHIHENASGFLARLLTNFIWISLEVKFLTVIMQLLGWIAGRPFKSGASDRLSQAMVLVARNVAIATAVAALFLFRMIGSSSP